MKQTQEQLQQGVKTAGKAFKAQNAKCMTCGEDFDTVGTYVHADQNEIGAPEGKLRVFIYPACQKCMGDENAMDIVEAYALSHFKTSN